MFCKSGDQSCMLWDEVLFFMSLDSGSHVITRLHAYYRRLYLTCNDPFAWLLNYLSPAAQTAYGYHIAIYMAFLPKDHDTLGFGKDVTLTDVMTLCLGVPNVKVSMSTISFDNRSRQNYGGSGVELDHCCSSPFKSSKIRRMHFQGSSTAHSALCAANIITDEGRVRRSCQHLDDFLVGLVIIVCVPFSLFVAKQNNCYAWMSSAVIKAEMHPASCLLTNFPALYVHFVLVCNFGCDEFS
ncbi:hypothetical protein VNO77_02530 [Canavalia gladiata]|uniref:Uncharacterized protein n=1 Tax=Canavalia gladiata TaxID=3824 RepID=A0AAN9RBD4_CANGL